MWRYFGSIGVVLILVAVSSGAEPLGLSVTGLPATYTPGGTLTFEVELTGATNLNAYNVGLALTSSKGTAGTDFYFEGSPGTTRPSDGGNGYVFDSALGIAPFGFVATAGTDLNTNTARLSLSDFLEDSQFVSDTRTDDILAATVIRTTPAAGDLALSFDGRVLELLTPSGQLISGSDTLVANLESFNPPLVAQVPEPSSISLVCSFFGLCGAILGWRRWVRGHKGHKED